MDLLHHAAKGVVGIFKGEEEVEWGTPDSPPLVSEQSQAKQKKTYRCYGFISYTEGT